MTTERERLQTLNDRLHELELRLPLPHERPILEVAREALLAEIRALAGRLQREYWRPMPVACLASAR